MIQLGHLVASADLCADNEPHEGSDVNMWIADPVQLPGRTDGNVADIERPVTGTDFVDSLTVKEKGYFNAFVAVPIEPPTLLVDSVPKPDCSQTWQSGFGQRLTRILTAYKSTEPQFPATHGVRCRHCKQRCLREKGEPWCASASAEGIFEFFQ